MHIYEYLFTATIIVIMLLSSSTMIGTISEPSRSTSEKEQLKVATQKLIAQILLDLGDPPDWGSNADINGSNLKTFGLAKYSETTRDVYVLDSDKVLRLDNNNPLYIPSSSVISLLNLGFEYGMALEIYPTLAVSINKTSDSGRYEIRVSSEYGELPVISANVTARMYYYDESSQQIANTIQINRTTSVDGKCIVDFGILAEKKILTLVVDYYGVHVVKVFDPSGSSVKRAYLLGNRLYGADISDNAIEIMVNKKAGSYTIESVSYSLSKDLEPSTVAVLAVSKDGSDLIFTSRLPASEASEEARLTYSSIPGVWSFPFAYSVERSVIICGSAYIIRLYLWRMSF